MDRLISEQGRIGHWTAICAAAALAVFGLLSGLAPTFAQGDEDALMPGSSAAVSVTQSGGVTRAKISVSVQTQEPDDGRYRPRRRKSIRARWLDTDMSSDVSMSSSSASGFHVTWVMSTTRLQDEFDEGGNFIELTFAKTHSFVNYTNSFMLLLDQGGTEAFGAKSSEDRFDFSFTVVNRVYSLMDEKLEIDLLWGLRYLNLNGHIHSIQITTDNDLDKQMQGAELGARGTLQLVDNESFTVRAFAEYRYAFNLRHDDNDRLEYYPNTPGAPYALFLDSIGEIQSVAAGLVVGSADSKLKAELAYVAEEITSGGTADNKRGYDGIRFGVTYDF